MTPQYNCVSEWWASGPPRISGESTHEQDDEHTTGPAARAVTLDPYAYEDRLSRPDSDWGRMQRRALILLAKHEAAGELPTNLRFLFYEGEGEGWWGKGERKTRKGTVAKRTVGQDLSVASMQLREWGIIPWEWIEDETREFTTWSYADTAENFLTVELNSLSLAPFGADPPPLILTESRSLSGVLERTVAARFRCPISPVGGQSSGALIATRIAPYLREHPESEVLYLGDLDIGGAAIETSLKRRIETHAGLTIPADRWNRLAITADQVPALEAEGKTPVPKVDNRYRPARHYEGWEAEALGQGPLVRLLTAALEDRCSIHPDDLEDAEQAARDHWQALVSDESYAYRPDWVDPRILTEIEDDAHFRLRRVAMESDPPQGDLILLLVALERMGRWERRRR